MVAAIFWLNQKWFFQLRQKKPLILKKKSLIFDPQKWIFKPTNQERLRDLWLLILISFIAIKKYSESTQPILKYNRLIPHNYKRFCGFFVKTNQFWGLLYTDFSVSSLFLDFRNRFLEYQEVERFQRQPIANIICITHNNFCLLRWYINWI